MTVYILASSSNGNCVFVGNDHTRVLIDAGLPRKDIARRLASIGEDINRLNAVLITHEHGDHTCGLEALVKGNQGLKVHCSVGTARRLPWTSEVITAFQAGQRFSLGSLEINTFTVPHDAADPIGYSVEGGGIRMAVVTDLGFISDCLRVNLRSCDFILLEANYDPEMLRVGPYPWPLKQRVMSRLGHLSNQAAASFIADDLDATVSTIVLGHLSEHNNHPEIVRYEGTKALNGRCTRLVVAEPDIPTEVFNL